LFEFFEFEQFIISQPDHDSNTMKDITDKGHRLGTSKFRGGGEIKLLRVVILFFRIK
jgi:hypothetical protein